MTSLLTLLIRLMVLLPGIKQPVDSCAVLTLEMLDNTFLCRYNKDGTVGPQIRSVDDYPTRDEILAGNKF